MLTKVRILVHDYCGHPFPTQLSRRLAGAGLDVAHVYSRSVVSPQGVLHRLRDDPPSLSFEPIELDKVIDRQAFVNRFFQERQYGRLLARRIQEFQPDVVISGNAPLEAQARCLRATRSAGAGFIFWLQDVHGIAIERLLGKRLGFLGRMIGVYYQHVEKRLLTRSNAVVAITEDFRPTLRNFGVQDCAIQVIPNWASTEEIPVRPKENRWAREHGLEEKFCFLYSGTLGMKHNPELLLQLAIENRESDDVSVVVASEGAGADWLRSQAHQLRLPGLKVLPFQPYDQYADVLAAADVLVGILEPDAGIFSVPSKVLSYLCAGRPILLAVPRENLAARTISESGAGIVADPLDQKAFLEAAALLRSDPARRAAMAAAARSYADKHFDLDRVTEKFREVIDAVIHAHRN